MRAVAYMPEMSSLRGFCTRISTWKWRLRSSTSGATATRRPDQVWPGRACTSTVAGMPTVQAARLELRHAGVQLQLAGVRHDDHALRIPGADERAGVEVALDDDATGRGGERGVTG